MSEIFKILSNMQIPYNNEENPHFNFEMTKEN